MLNSIQVVPRNLIFAHLSKVTALAKASDGWDNDFSIVSAAENGLVLLVYCTCDEQIDIKLNKVSRCLTFIYRDLIKLGV